MATNVSFLILSFPMPLFDLEVCRCSTFLMETPGTKTFGFRSKKPSILYIASTSAKPPTMTEEAEAPCRTVYTKTLQLRIIPILSQSHEGWHRAISICLDISLATVGKIEMRCQLENQLSRRKQTSDEREKDKSSHMSHPLSLMRNMASRIAENILELNIPQGGPLSATVVNLEQTHLPDGDSTLPPQDRRVLRLDLRCGIVRGPNGATLFCASFCSASPRRNTIALGFSTAPGATVRPAR